MEGSDGPHRPHRGRLILLLLLLAILLERSTFMPERLFERQVEAMKFSEGVSMTIVG